MGIIKYYEFTCETCGNADYPPGSSIKRAKEIFKDEKGIIIADKIYCNKECFTDKKITPSNN